MINLQCLQYDKIFEQTSSLYMLLSPEFTILQASNAYLHATMTKRKEIIGKYLFDIFPDDPSDPEVEGEASGVKNLTFSLQYVLKTKKPHLMNIQKYNVRSPNGEFTEKFWTPLNTPIFNENDDILYILHEVDEVSEFVKLKKEMAATSESLGKMEIIMFNRAEQIQKQAQELEIARDQAIALANFKSAIVANVSHELRTPLTCILGYNELLIQTSPNSEQLNLIHLINGAAKMLLSVVNDILDLSKINAGKMVLDEKPVNIHEIIRNITDGVTFLSNEKELKMHIVVEPGLPNCVITDTRRLTQILYNLLTNAIKFTPKNGTITLRVSQNKDDKDVFKNLVFIVSDTGIGIPKDKLKFLFQPFGQIDTSLTRAYTGTGLGLAISKMLTELMGGEIGVTSVEGAGSTFSFTIFPKLCQSHELNKSSEQNQSLFTTYTDDDDLQRTLSLSNVHVLIVEDNTMIQQLVKKQLQILQVQYSGANNGEEAVQLFLNSQNEGNETFDAILMDCQMPIMDGFTATKTIRTSCELGKQIPIIAMTASVMQEDKTQCFDSGMSDVLAKPFDIARLRDILLKWTV